eukprot:scaffold177801_cov28-Tisochrysis_lutea.AAC.2
MSPALLLDRPPPSTRPASKDNVTQAATMQAARRVGNETKAESTWPAPRARSHWGHLAGYPAALTRISD